MLTVHETCPAPLAWFALTDQPERVAPIGSGGEARDGSDVAWQMDWTPEEHRRDVAHVRAQIERGDTYQCNLTVRMRGRCSGAPEELYRRLALGQRGAYNAYLDTGRLVIASASPELFFERRGDELLMRPMKGTAARGRTLAEDRTNSERLRVSAKERAENVMIVDLIRNDLARIARIGGVRVATLCEVERYETVLQLTSDVIAQMRPGVGLTELFTALFPSGSVTGAPKVSTMKLIRELEATPRGVYCGAIGYVAPPGATVRARFSVAIRTAVVDQASGTAEYGVGSGITWSSDPADEHEEVLTKTAVLHRPTTDVDLIETMRFDPGSGIRNLDRHLRRLAESAEYFGYPVDVEATAEELGRELRDAGPCRVRLLLDRAGRLRIERSELPVDCEPVRVILDHQPIDSASMWLYHKTTNRDLYQQRQYKHPGVDDVVMVNERGELTEATRANLAVQRNGRWWTPPISSGCLPGVERARLLAEGALSEAVLEPADLVQAEAIALLNSLRGWRTAELTACGEADVGVRPAGR